MKILNKVSAIVLTSVFTLGLTGPITAFAATSPDLGAADSFAILAGTPNITNVPTSVITGNVGLSPATGAGIGLTGAQVTGTIYAVNATGPSGVAGNNPILLTTAKNNLTTAYDGLAALDNATCTADYSGTGVVDLTTKSPLSPGVYCADSFSLTGALVLTGTSGVWIFRAATTIITSAGSSVTGGDPCNVWWRAASSATLNTTTSFVGNILALSSISMKTGATLTGRALARNGAVTLEQNTINTGICVDTAKATAAKATADTEATAAATAAKTAADTAATAAATATPAAKFPKTGIAPSSHNSIPWNIVILAGIFTVSILFVLIRRKRRTI